MNPQNENNSIPNNQPQTQAVKPITPPPSQQQVQQFPQSASSMGLNNPPKQKSPWRRKLSKIAISLVVLVALIVAGSLVFVGYHLPTTTYDNGVGQKFSLKFYRNSTTKPDVPPFMTSRESGAKFLVASTQGDYPVALLITKRTEDQPSLYDEKTANMCKEPPITIARKGATSAVCTFGQSLSEKQTVYFYEFTDKGARYFVIITQDSPADVTTNPETNQEAHNEVDLRKYNDDLKVILESINVE
ncbi:hypothetical protein KC968_04405 [Candidatus Saccharibacteria bacterium]|nr:hypothetical protein [Candidatus Saccharibacteria bacterium]